MMEKLKKYFEYADSKGFYPEEGKIFSDKDLADINEMRDKVFGMGWRQ